QIGSTQPAAKNLQKSRGVIPASNTEAEPDDGLIRNIPVDSSAAKAVSVTNAAKPAEAEATAPPQVSMVSSSEDPLNGMLGATTSLPQLAKQQSQGATPIVLERKVMPTYPQQAQTLRREGMVVIHATVSETGKVLQMKLVSGDPLLGKAAMDAIRQWRYRPAVLNGVPTVSETDIPLNFKLP
ncbi:MAG TPA: TonB family protein, partial [Terriglobales bacterium]|nr:TonB family protein [Terriglobales bacterium]